MNLYFPRLAPAGAANDATQDGAAGRTQGGREQILVVEDTDDMRELTVAQLQRLGYTVFSADQGADAVELLERHRDVTLLLTDVSLPGGINGRQLAERAQRMRPNLKVLYMSGYTEEALIHQGRLDPGIRLLQKPFHNDDLATQVRAALAEILNSVSPRWK